MTLKPHISAAELEALLSNPIKTGDGYDKYFPMRLWLIVLFGFIWFVRLTAFNNEVATSLFDDVSVRDYMHTALYYRAWLMFACIALGFFAYKSNKFPAISFLVMFLISITNLIADLSIFYKDKLANPDFALTVIILARLFVCYLLYKSIRNANQIPLGKDKWNPFLPFNKN